MERLPLFRPTKRDPWDARKAAHLLNRAGFGGTPGEVEAVVRKGPEAAVRELVDFENVLDTTPPPSWVTDPPDPPELPPLVREPGEDPEEVANRRRMALQMILRQQRQMMEELRSWWLLRMVTTPRPLQEKLALFWHGHFATQAQKVRQPLLMYRQNVLFRTHAVGNFKTLVLEVSRDPAMLRYLDNNTNRKEHPNENYARELMELFTMGIGNYTEEDVKEAARAFTGWTFGLPGPFAGAFAAGPGPQMRRPGRAAAAPVFVFRRQFHDDGEKRFLGRTGNFDGEEIVNIIFEQPVTARFICGKLYAFFAGDEPAPPGVVEALAEILRTSRYELKPVLEALFRSEAFYRDGVIGGQIKSPVQLVAQVLRQTGATVEPPQALNAVLRQMGQVLLDPPNVKGWDSGQAWITTSTLTARYNFANFLVNGAPIGGRPPQGAGAFLALRGRRFQARIDVKSLLPLGGRRDPEEIVDHLSRRLLSVPLSPEHRAELIGFLKKPTEDAEAQLRGLIHLIMSTPNYQLC